MKKKKIKNCLIRKWKKFELFQASHIKRYGLIGKHEKGDESI